MGELTDQKQKHWEVVKLNFGTYFFIGAYATKNLGFYPPLPHHTVVNVGRVGHYKLNLNFLVVLSSSRFLL